MKLTFPALPHLALPPAPPVPLYALKDLDTGETYPLPECRFWSEAFWLMEAHAHGDDNALLGSLLVPPPPAARLCILVLLSRGQEERRERERQARQAHIDAEIAALGFRVGPPDRPAPEAAPGRAERFTASFLRFFCRGDVTLAVLAFCAALLVARRFFHA